MNDLDLGKLLINKSACTQQANHKGQKISKANCVVLTSSKKPMKYLPISALATIRQKKANIPSVFWRI
jgi:hypothetical protein